jgi:hypothetical protein
MSLIEHSIDTGFIVAGRTTSFGAGSYDFMLVKTDSVGVELWTKTYGGSAIDWAFSVIEHSIDNGLVIAGRTTSFGAGSFSMMLVKTDSVGIEVWTKTYGGPGSDTANSVIEHSIDTGFVLAGKTSSFSAGSQVLVKTNSVGVVQWTKTYGGSGTDEAYCVIEHSLDQGLLLAGRTTSYGAGNVDMMLVKTNSVGIEVWTKTYGGTAHDEAWSVIEHSIDQGLVLAGYTSSHGAGSYDFMLVKTNSVGVAVWTKTYGGAGDDVAYSSSIEHSINNKLVFAGQTDSHGAGYDDIMLVIQPSDGSGTAGANATPTEGTQSLTEADQTFTEGTPTLTEGDVTLADADQTVTTTVVFANPTPSQSLSQSSSPSVSQAVSSTQTATQSQTSAASQSTSPFGSQTSTHTASQTIAASQSSASSHAATPTTSQIMVTPSVSASANVDDPCDDHLCASGAGCVVVDSETQYKCDCTAISTAAVRMVGLYCNTTVEGKPVSVGDNNCPGCESAFVCTDSYSGDGPDTFMESVIPLLAGVACGCANPPQALLDQFGAVQYQVQDDKSLCMEFTIYSGNPNITAADIVQDLEDTPPDTFIVQTNRLTDFEPCDDEVDGCNSGGSGGDDSLLFIIIGVAAFCLILLLGTVWYCLHKRVDRQFQLQNEVTIIVNDVVVHKIQADMSDAGDIKTIDNNLKPATANQERLTDHQSSSNNNINVPTAAASTGPRYSAFTKSVDTAAKEDDFEY